MHRSVCGKRGEGKRGTAAENEIRSFAKVESTGGLTLVNSPYGDEPRPALVSWLLPIA